METFGRETHNPTPPPLVTLQYDVTEADTTYSLTTLYFSRTRIRETIVENTYFYHPPHPSTPQLVLFFKKCPPKRSKCRKTPLKGWRIAKGVPYRHSSLSIIYSIRLKGRYLLWQLRILHGKGAIVAQITKFMTHY